MSSENEVEGLTASTAARWKKVDYLSLGTYASASICAGLEIAEDVSEVGHGHGVVLLTLSKIFKEIAEVRRLTGEEGEELMEEIKPKGFVAKLFEPILHVLSSVYLISTIAILALWAAFKEVSESMEIGGHHGMIFLAFHDILELLEESHLVTKIKPLEKTVDNSVLKLTLMGAALASAAVETIQSFAQKKVGAHHGVLLLAVMRTFSALGIFRRERKELKEKKE